MFTCMSFGTLVAVSLFGSFIYTTKNQACFSLLYTLNANKNLIVLNLNLVYFYSIKHIYIIIGALHNIIKKNKNSIKYYK